MKYSTLLQGKPHRNFLSVDACCSKSIESNLPHPRQMCHRENPCAVSCSTSTYSSLPVETGILFPWAKTDRLKTITIKKLTAEYIVFIVLVFLIINLFYIVAN